MSEAAPSTSIPLLCFGAGLVIFLAGCGGDSSEPVVRAAAPPLEEPAPLDRVPQSFPDLSLLKEKSELPEIIVATIDQRPPTTGGEALDGLRDISIRYPNGTIPRALANPFTCYSAISYCQAMKQLESQRKSDLNWVTSIDANKLAEADETTQQAVARKCAALEMRLANEVAGQIEESLAASRFHLDLDIDLLFEFARTASKSETTDPRAIIRYDQTLDRLLQLVNAAILIDNLRSETSDATRLKGEIVGLIEDFDSRVERIADSIEIVTDPRHDELKSVAFDLLNLTEGFRENWVQLQVIDRSKQIAGVYYQLSDNGIAEMKCHWKTFSLVTIEATADGSGEMFLYQLVSYQRAPPSVPVDQWHVELRKRLGPVTVE